MTPVLHESHIDGDLAALVLTDLLCCRWSILKRTPYLLPFESYVLKYVFKKQKRAFFCITTLWCYQTNKSRLFGTIKECAFLLYFSIAMYFTYHKIRSKRTACQFGHVHRDVPPSGSSSLPLPHRPCAWAVPHSPPFLLEGMLSPWQPRTDPPSLWIRLFRMCHVNGVAPYEVLGVWLL